MIKPEVWWHFLEISDLLEYTRNAGREGNVEANVGKHVIELGVTRVQVNKGTLLIFVMKL